MVLGLRFGAGAATSGAGAGAPAAPALATGMIVIPVQQPLISSSRLVLWALCLPCLCCLSNHPIIVMIADAARYMPEAHAGYHLLQYNNCS